ncbi:MAG: hypothetical protein WBC04_15435 [Candidatus Acidiferrales bacterium]
MKVNLCNASAPRSEKLETGNRRILLPLVLLVFAVMASTMAALTVRSQTTNDPTTIPNLRLFHDPTGEIATFNTAGDIDITNPFFQDLGTNGRRCVTCHEPNDAFALRVEPVRERFARTNGSDPLFAAVDGANCPDVKPEDAAGHSLLLKNGLIRVFLPVPQPPVAQFTVSVVHDPYGCALVADPSSGQQILSVYRRPLPTTNLGFLSTVMFDGRETINPLP